MDTNWIIYDDHDDGQVEEIFTIYTTGITNWAEDNRSYHDIIYQWISGNILNNIVRYIPDRFRIYVKHYDPMDDLGGAEHMWDGKSIDKYIDSKITNGLIPIDITIRQVISSEFIKDVLPIGDILYQSGQHVIIDFAHIFNIGYMVGVVNISGEELPLNVIRIYPENEFDINTLQSSQLLEVSDDNKVTTFIDKMKELGILDIFDNSVEPIIILKRYVDGLYITQRMFKQNIEDKLIKSKGLVLGSAELNEEVKKNPEYIEYLQKKKRRFNNIFRCMWLTDGIILSCLDTDI